MTKLNMSGSNVGAKGICAVIDTNGTVLPVLATDNGDGTATLKIDGEFTAAIDPGTLATHTGQDEIKAVVNQTDIGSPVRITNDGTSKSVAVPALARSFACQAELGEVRLEINGAASATSTLRVPEDTWFIYPIVGGTQTLYSFGIVGTYSNVRFLG